MTIVDGTLGKSTMTNCYLAPREGDEGVLFWEKDGVAGFNLVGYAIVPLETFASHLANVKDITNASD